MPVLTPTFTVDTDQVRAEIRAAADGMTRARIARHVLGFKASRDSAAARDPHNLHPHHQAEDDTRYREWLRIWRAVAPGHVYDTAADTGRRPTPPAAPAPPEMFTLTYSTTGRGGEDRTVTRHLTAKGVEYNGRIVASRADRGDAWDIAVLNTAGDDVTDTFACFQD
jgi:hypothetical protein